MVTRSSLPALGLLVLGLAIGCGNTIEEPAKARSDDAGPRSSSHRQILDTLLEIKSRTDDENRYQGEGAAEPVRLAFP